ncbi:MAG: Gldg family protein [Balneolaceae bacterium]|nr:Gldg family protein [Balneolaceae bacterium]
MEWFKGFLKNRREARYQLLLVVGIAITLNLLAEELVLRFDLTEDQRYTLSEASSDIAESLEDPVTVTAYFSEDLPPQLSQARDQFRNFLEEFRAYSDENLEYRFVNPNESEQTEQEAQQVGIQPVMIDVRERDQVSQRRVYLGASFSYGEQREVVPFIRPGSSLEYAIASTIKKLTIKEKPVIGLLQGHGEPSQDAIVQVANELSQRYRILDVAGLDTAAVPPEVEVLMVIAPSEELALNELTAIDQYLMAGGKVIFAINRVQADLQRGFATPQETGIEDLLAGYNIPVNPNLIRDASASSIQIQQRQGGFTFVNQVQYPYLPMVTNFGAHPVSEGLETVVFQFVSSLDTADVDSVQSVRLLAMSSDQAGISSGRFNLDPMQDWSEEDFPESSIPLGAVVEGRFRSAFAGVDTVEVALEKSQETAIIVFGDGDFVINGTGQQRQRQPEDNINLMVNSVDWLADDTGLMSLRTKGVTNRPLMNVSDGTKAFLKYLNLLFPILMVVGYGLLRYRRRIARRRRWMEEGV